MARSSSLYPELVEGAWPWSVALFLCLASSACANPTVIPDPLNIVSYVMVLGSATAIEAGAITLLLLFWGLEPRLYVAFAAGNLALYFIAFLPMLGSVNLWISELTIVVLDAALIKLLTRFDALRGDTFRPVKWPWAFAIAAVGNISSWYIGSVATA